MDARFAPDAFWARLRAQLDDVPEGERVPPPAARAGAVLVLVEDTPDGPQVVLTRRRLDMRSHPGQISFPGGRIDTGETVQEAALREAREEIGLDPATVDVVGIVPRFYIPPSRFWIVPVVARWTHPHPLDENPWEVDAILRVPFAAFLDHACQRWVRMSARDPSWAWEFDRDLIWGATARVLHAVLDIAVPTWDDGRTPEALGDRAMVAPWERQPRWTRRTRLDGELPKLLHSEVPHVTQAQMRAARAWMHVRGVGLQERAEQAARALAHATRRMSGGDVDGLDVTVLAGPSSNGAGGLVAARLLGSAGAHVKVLTAGVPRAPEQTHVLRDMGVAVEPVTDVEDLDTHDPGRVVIDAMLGIGAEPPLRDLPHRAMLWLQRHDVGIIALELPSGLSADEGLAGACMPADVTVALGLPTVGLLAARAQPMVGDVYLADLGFPIDAWQAAGVAVRESPFRAGPLVRLLATAEAVDDNEAVGEASETLGDGEIDSA